MESLLARALEYTLKYWLKSFSRDQFKLQGRNVQLLSLDMNGDALHSSMGLPLALHVTTTRASKLVILLPSVSNVQVEPIVVQIDKLDLVLEENMELDASSSTPSSNSVACTSPSSAASGKGSGYGFADKVGVEGLQILKSHAQTYNNPAVVHVNGIKESAGVNLEFRLVTIEDSVDHEMVECVVENVKFSVEKPP